MGMEGTGHSFQTERMCLDSWRRSCRTVAEYLQGWTNSPAPSTKSCQRKKSAPQQEGRRYCYASLKRGKRCQIQLLFSCYSGVSSPERGVVGAESRAGGKKWDFLIRFSSKALCLSQREIKSCRNSYRPGIFNDLDGGAPVAIRLATNMKHPLTEDCCWVTVWLLSRHASSSTSGQQRRYSIISC